LLDNSIITDKDVRDFIENGFVLRKCLREWGKTVAEANEYIQCDLIKYYLGNNVVSDVINDDGNGAGFDIYTNLKYKKIQSKLRQVDGKTPYSRQICFENTRRNSDKNVNNSLNGYTPYSIDEFDAVLVTLIHYKGRDKKEVRKNINNWNFSLIPVDELENPQRKGYCINSISSKLLDKYKLELKKDWEKLFK